MCDKRIKTVVFGGSFDPIHNGHIALAREVVSRGMAQEVWFMVSPQNPHKTDCRLTDENVRLLMVQKAIEGEMGFVACDFEFSLPRPSYTLHTLDALEKAYPDRCFTLLVGADNWEKFDKWYKGDEIVRRFGLVVYPRGGESMPSLSQGIVWLDAELHDVSSTQIRDILVSGGDASPFLPPAVHKYIVENKLYK